MSASKNKGVVYSGRVGAKMRPPSVRPSKGATVRHAVQLKGGPLAGGCALLCQGSTTLALAPMKGWGAGQYVKGSWLTFEDQAVLKEAA